MARRRERHLITAHGETRRTPRRLLEPADELPDPLLHPQDTMTRHRTFRARPVRVLAALAAALAIAATSLVVAAAPAPASTASTGLAAASLPSPSTVNEVKPGPQDPKKPPRATADNDQYHSLIFIPGCFDVDTC
jgi:hypothetical protein